MMNLNTDIGTFGGTTDDGGGEEYGDEGAESAGWRVMGSD